VRTHLVFLTIALAAVPALTQAQQKPAPTPQQAPPSQAQAAWAPSGTLDFGARLTDTEADEAR